MPTRFRRRSDLLERVAPEGLLLLAPECDRIMILDPAASQLWDQLESAQSLDELVRSVGASFADSAIRTDLEDAIRVLEENGLLLTA